MKLIKKYLYGKTVLPVDSPVQVALNTLGKDSEAGKKLRQDQVTALQIINGETPHYVFTDNPQAFVYNGDLMVRGSELLKYPLLYTHMGWIDTKDSPILSDLYYKFGSNGAFDPTRFVAFSNLDTFTPISDGYLQNILNYNFAKNAEYAKYNENRKQGSITLGKDETFQEQIRVPLGFSPGADAAYQQYLMNPTKENADNFRSIASTIGAGNETIAGMSPAGSAVFTPLMAGSAYDRLSNPKGWLDYVFGTGEGVMAGLSLLGPAFKTYLGVRSAANSRYALSKAIESAPLDVSMLNSYRLPSPQQRYLFSNWQTFNGSHPFSYLQGHIHDIDLSDIGIMLARHGYFDNPAQGKFRIEAKLPSGKSIQIKQTKTLPINYPVLVSANPELPLGYWGKRGDRPYPERVINSSDVKEVKQSDKAIVAGFVSNGKVHVTSSFPAVNEEFRSFPRLLLDLNSDNPSDNIAGVINDARKYWDTHALVDEATPARDPFKRGAKKSYIPFVFSNNPGSSSRNTYLKIWGSGKQQTIDYLMSDTHKERLMNKLKLTEQLADAFILLELRNLENVELVNLGLHKVGRPFGHTIGYTVEGESGNGMFDRIKGKSDWVPDPWSELKYRNYIDSYVLHAIAYDKAKRGITQVGIAEGDKPAGVNVGFEEGTHATTRGGTDPVLSPIIEHDTKLAANLLGQDPGMLDPVEARTIGIELDRAWDALKDNLPEYYRRLSPSALRRLFFYDILRASNDAGRRFYKSVPAEWAQRFDPKYNYILNKGANGLDPDEALYNFWENFVYNLGNSSTPNNFDIT